MHPPIEDGAMNQTLQTDLALQTLPDHVRAGHCILFLGAALHAPPADSFRDLPWGAILHKNWLKHVDMEVSFPTKVAEISKG